MQLEINELPKSAQKDMCQGERFILRLTYISCYNTSNANIEIARILEQARRNNELNDITGVLLINESYFLQVIEGARPVINKLLRGLVKDSRHLLLQIVECQEIEQRRWSEWSMKYLTLDNKDKNFVLRFSSGSTFNPYMMSSSQIMSFVEALSERQERLSPAS